MARFGKLTKGLALASLGAGCTLIYDAGDFEGRSRPDTGVSPIDAAPEAAPLPVDPCEHASPPARPNAGDPGEQSSIVFALSDLVLTVADADRVGFDLDGVCTCDNRPNTDGGSSCAPTKIENVCDLDGGRDNGLARLLGQLPIAQSDSGLTVGFDLSAKEGVETLVVEVGKYNGTSVDPSVSFALFDAPGLDPPSPCDGGSVGDAGLNGIGKPRPAWLGCDAWKLGSGSLAGDVPLTFARDAWVTDGVLVARLDALAIRLGDSVLPVYGATITAKLVNGPGLPRLENGILAGRARAPDLLRAMGEQSPTDAGPLCNDVRFLLFKAGLCASLDMSENSTPGAACDSLSFSVKFEAKAARKGSVAPSANPSSKCATAGDFAKCP
jgi:hypothetical protein